MKKKVSLKDIAKELGVSTTLVSFVMNNKEKEGRVGKEMARKIRETAERLNYQPNYIARSLRNKKTQTIGLIVADISNPFFANLARIIEDEANRNNYTVIIGSSDESPEKMEKVLNFLISRQVDGFIIVPTEGSHKLISSLKENRIPFVLMDRCFHSIHASCVAINNFQASLDAMQYLLKKGYKRIGIVTYRSTLSHFRERVNGYRKGLSNYGIAIDHQLIKRIEYSNLNNEIEVAIAELIDNEHVESIYFTTNTLALHGLKCIFGRGVKIPDDLDIMAFDSSEAYHFFQYPIPHVTQPTREMGIKSVELLIDQLEHLDLKKIRRVYLDAKLVVGQTLKFAK